MTPSVHRAKCVTAAVRAVELLSLPLHPSSSLRVRFAYLPTRDQTQIRFSRPRSSTTAICEFETNPPRGKRVASLDLSSAARSWLSSLDRCCALEDAISRIVGRFHLEKKKWRKQTSRFPEYNLCFVFVSEVKLSL